MIFLTELINNFTQKRGTEIGRNQVISTISLICKHKWFLHVMTVERARGKCKY